MPDDLNCSITHRQLLSGECPWCGTPIEKGHIAPTGTPRKGVERRWSIPVLISALDDPDTQLRKKAISNVAMYVRDYRECLPVLQKALSNDQYFVRFLATRTLCQLSRGLQAPGAEGLEESVRSDPDNFAARIMLLCYYSTRMTENAQACSARYAHILWIIEHRPASEFAGLAEAYLYDGDDVHVCERARSLWHEQLRKLSRNPTVLKNAAKFFQFQPSNPDFSESLLEKAREMDPTDPRTCVRLIHLYGMRIRANPDNNQIVEKQKTLAKMESLLNTIEDKKKRASVLPELSAAALAAGCGDRARAFASEVLGLSRKDYAGGLANEHHRAHLILGRLALRSGDRNLAISHLSQAGQAEATAVLASFGPGMTLAKELLEAGEREAVIRYLESCGKFWTPRDHDLDVWVHEIKQGSIPDFGPNLAW